MGRPLAILPSQALLISYQNNNKNNPKARERTGRERERFFRLPASEKSGRHVLTISSPPRIPFTERQIGHYPSGQITGFALPPSPIMRATSSHLHPIRTHSIPKTGTFLISPNAWPVDQVPRPGEGARPNMSVRLRFFPQIHAQI